MKSKCGFIPLMLVGMSIVALGSWVANLYGVGEVQNLLSADGLRHEVRCGLTEYMTCPELLVYLILSPGVGLAADSGLLNALSRLLHGRVLLPRERRSINWTLVTGALYVTLVCLSVFGPWAVWRSVTGSLWPSPFADTLPLIVSVGLALVGSVYGYASGQFSRYDDVRCALERPLRRWAGYPVALFFVVRLFGQLSYTRLPEAIGISQGIVTVVFHVVAVLLFVCFTGIWEVRIRK